MSVARPARRSLLSLARGQLGTVGAFLLRPIDVFRTYRLAYLRPDIIAGLTVAVVTLPQAMAYALIAELPPEIGLYAAVVGAIVGALWGSSSQLQTGPTNTTSLLILSVLLSVASPGTPEYILAAGMMALLVGLMRLAMGLARLGILVNFVSDSVIVGFTAGAGALILINQIRHLLRLSIPSLPGLWQTLPAIATHVRPGTTNASRKDSATLNAKAFPPSASVMTKNTRVPIAETLLVRPKRPKYSPIFSGGASSTRILRPADWIPASPIGPRAINAPTNSTVLWVSEQITRVTTKASALT